MANSTRLRTAADRLRRTGRHDTGRRSPGRERSWTTGALTDPTPRLRHDARVHAGAVEALHTGAIVPTGSIGLDDGSAVAPTAPTEVCSIPPGSAVDEAGGSAELDAR